MKQLVRRTVAVLACLTLSGFAITQTAGEAQAAGGDYDKEKTTQTQQQQQKQQMTSKEKADYIKEWSKAEEPGQAYGQYASSGLLMVHNTLSDIVEQAKEQPIGGGPADQQQMEQQQQAMQGVEQQFIQLENYANELSDNKNLMEHPQQFQEAANSVVSVLDSLQKARFTGLEKDVKQVRDSAAKIEVNKPLAAQQKEVSNFFEHTSDAIGKMSEEVEKGAVGGGPEEQQDKPEQKQEQQNQPEQQQEPTE